MPKMMSNNVIRTSPPKPKMETVKTMNSQGDMMSTPKMVMPSHNNTMVYGPDGKPMMGKMMGESGMMDDMPAAYHRGRGPQKTKPRA